MPSQIPTGLVTAIIRNFRDLNSGSAGGVGTITEAIRTGKSGNCRELRPNELGGLELCRKVSECHVACAVQFMCGSMTRPPSIHYQADLESQVAQNNMALYFKLAHNSLRVAHSHDRPLAFPGKLSRS